MNLAVALGTKRDQIYTSVVAEAAPRANVMYFKAI